MRLEFGVEYDGTDWSGWQTQVTRNTIQDCLESSINSFSNESTRVVCAGRTDAGVHARGQVIHFDTPICRELDSWQRGVNSFLPDSIAISWVAEVSDKFHARYSALSRVYSYSILNQPTRSPLESRMKTWVFQPLDSCKMRDAALLFVGEHDYSAVRSSDCQANSPIRLVYKCDVEKRGPFIKIEIEANSFLHHMVRNIVGCLFEVGRGAKPVNWIPELLDSRCRGFGGKTFPPQGLCFESVNYGPDYPCGHV